VGYIRKEGTLTKVRTHINTGWYC